MSIAPSARIHLLHTLCSGTDGGKKFPSSPSKSFITPRVEVGVTRLANKEAPQPQPRRPRLAARSAPRRQFAARFRAQELMVELGAHATLGERARSAAQLRELRTRGPVLSPTVGATYKPGSWPTSPAKAAALSPISRRPGARREAGAPYLRRLPVCFLIVKKRSVSPETTSRLDIGSISEETSGQT